MCTFRIFSESGVLAHWTSLPYGIAQILLLLYIMSLHLYRFLLHIYSLCLCISVGISLSPSLQSPPHRNLSAGNFWEFVSTLILPLTRIITDTLNSPTEIPGVTTETIMMCQESLEIIKQTPKVTRELIPED